MTLGMGKCVADGSQGSCLMITSVHDKQFIRSIWTVMLTKEILFSIELWHEMSPECTIMNQRIRDNQSSGNTHCLRPTKSTRHRLPLGKSCWPSFSGTILVHFRQKGETVTGARYSDMLVNELKLAIRAKCRGLLSKRVLLLHDNARPHTLRTVDTLRALKHPPYSPDLAPSDFHLFGLMNIWGARSLQMFILYWYIEVYILIYLSFIFSYIYICIYTHIHMYILYYIHTHV